MNLAFLVAVCSCNVILGEIFKSEMGFMEERLERTEADESREVNMEVMANASRVAVISTVHNVQFVKYIFPRNRTSSDIS